MPTTCYKIFLVPIISTVMEKLLSKTTSHKFEDHQNHHSSSACFREQRSIGDHLAYLILAFPMRSIELGIMEFWINWDHVALVDLILSEKCFYKVARDDKKSDSPL